jgi:hypothetical protein
VKAELEHTQWTMLQPGGCIVTGESNVWFAQSTKLLPMEVVASEYLAARRVTVT